MNDEYLSMTEIGKFFDASSHDIGRWLIEIDLRTQEKMPSQRAKNEGFVSTAPNGRDTGWFFVWHREKTI